MTDDNSGGPPPIKRPVRVPRPADLRPLNTANLTPPPVGRLKDILAELTQEPPMTAPTDESVEDLLNNPNLAETFRPEAFDAYDADRASLEVERESWPEAELEEGLFDTDDEPEERPRPSVNPEQQARLDEARSPSGGPPRPSNAPGMLRDRGLTATFTARAEWFELQAEQVPDNSKRGRAWLICSELWAMAGASDRARAAAERASKYGNLLAARQVRQLATTEGDPAALGMLAAEIHSAPTAAARTHAATISAEYERSRGADAAASARHLDQAARNDASDPRPGLYRLARQLGSTAKPPTQRWPKLDCFNSLERAAATLSSLRGELRSAAPIEEPVAPVVSFFEVSRALARADRVGAANALLTLSNYPGFSRTSRWLAAALYAPLASTRGRSAELLSELLRERPSVAIRRALGARALELGDRSLLDLALVGDTAPESSEPSLSVPDRVAFAVLLDSAPEELLLWLEHAARHEELRPLSQALYSALDRPEANTDPGPLRVGRILGAGGSSFEVALTLDSAAIPGELSRALALEVAFQNRDVKAIAEALLGLAHGQDEERGRHAHLAAALLLEQAGQIELAEGHYAHALSSSAFGEVATRALITLLPKGRASKLLSALAPTIRDEERRGLLLFEAALKTQDTAEAVALTQASHELYPSLALQVAVGQRLTLGEESPARAIAWLNTEAALAESDYERALVAVRQALLSGEDAEQASHYLAAAWESWPKDITLLELQERLTTAPLPVRAKNRELLAASLTDAGGRSRLLLEAARYYEHAGHDAEAARVAEVAMRHEPLARICFERTAARTPRVVSIKNALEADLSTAETPRKRAELCLRLASIEARAGNDAAQAQWLHSAVTHDSGFLRALLEYEQFALQRGQTRDLARVELLIAKQLSSVESSAHALLAARFAQLDSGWNSAFPALSFAANGSETPVWIARKLLPHVARGVDDALYYAMLDVVQRATPHELDRATLLLRSAEAASRLGDAAKTLDHLTEAVRLAPNHAVAQSMRAESLLASGESARAAEAYERVARLSTVPEHQTAAWKTAASLWLQVEDPDRAQAAFERAFKAAPSDDEVFDALLARYRQAHAKQKLLDLLQARTEASRRPEERTRLRLLESRILIEFGDRKAARATLELLLSTNPEDVAALTQLAELAEAEENVTSAEQVLLQLARLNPDPQTQADTYAKLALLYQGPLNQPQRALRCQQEVLRRRPTDMAAFAALISLLVDQNQVEKALALISDQDKLVTTDESKRTLSLCLARIQTRGLRDFPGAEQSYQEALTSWPKHPEVLSGLVDLYQTSGNRTALNALALSFGTEVREQLPDKPELDAALQATRLVAELDGDDCAATLTNVLQQALEGTSVLWPGAQGRAMSRNLDELLAPKPISSALRSLLMQTHAALDGAFDLDLAEIGAEPLTSQRVITGFEVKARSMGIACPQLFVIASSPYACLVTNNPSRVILGKSWIEDALPSSLDFLAWRSLKLVQARVGIIERLRGQQLLATLEAFLGCFVDSKPGLADPRLVEAMRRRLVEHLPKRLDDDLPVLALSVVADLKERQLALDDAIRRWVNRSALLATGDLRAALHALALKQGVTPPTNGAETIRFLKQSPEGLDLAGVLFDAGFLDACRMTKEP